MKPLTSTELRKLAMDDGLPRMTLLLPLEISPARAHVNALRVKGGLKALEEKAVAMGYAAGQVRDWLAPAARWLQEAKWDEPTSGVAMFLSPRQAMILSVTVPITEESTVGPHFSIRQLTPLLSGECPFYLLCLGQRGVRLLRGSRFGIADVHLADMPQDLDESFDLKDFEKMLRSHSGTSIKMGRGGEIYHGHGDTGLDDRKQVLKQFFALLDKHLMHHLRDKSLPLVLAGLDHHIALYRQVNSYPRLETQAITHHAVEEAVLPLWKEAWKLVEPEFKQRRNVWMHSYQQLTGTGRTSHDVREIMVAARQGGIETLFIDPTVAHWGRISADSHEVLLTDADDVNRVDLVNAAIVHALRHRAAVHTIDPGEFPDRRSIYAIYHAGWMPRLSAAGAPIVS